MIHYFNIFSESHRYCMVNIHEFISAPAFFTFIVRSFTNKFFYSRPSISICFLAIASHPTWTIFPMQSIFCPPMSRTGMRTKVMLFSTEIRGRSFKFFLAPFAYLGNSIFWASATIRTFMVAYYRTILSFITLEIKKIFFTNRAVLFLRPLIIFPPRYLFAIFIFPFHISILSYVVELDKDYYNAAMKRLDDHKRQGVLFMPKVIYGH